MQNIDRIIALIEAKTPAYIALSDKVWDLAELRYQEQKSVQAQIEALEREGFKVTPGVAGIPTAFQAEAGSGGPLIGFLGEYDALSGLSQRAGLTERVSADGPNGQGCGHNLLGTGAILAAAAVKDYLAANKLPGTIRYYGCPAEEGGSGKTFMARAGMFADLDAAVTWHPGNFFGVMSVRTLANIQAYFRFSGRAAHAAGAPHLGRSALDAVELMSVGVNYMREHMPPDARVHCAVTNTGGISPNVVQAKAEALYLIRAPDVAETIELFERVKKIAEGAALMTETQAVVEFDKACSNVLPNTALEMALHQNAQRLGPTPFDDGDRAFAEKLRKAAMTPADVAASLRQAGLQSGYQKVLHEDILPFDGTPQMLYGSTDVGDVSWVTPTVQAWGACFAVGTPGHSWQLVTQGKLPAAHRGMIHAAKAMAATAIDAIENPALLARAKAELKERVTGKAYVCPIPASVELPFKRRPDGGMPLGAPASPHVAGPLARAKLPA
ncbi:MAG: amidohydrolase [Alphaproteobacteria bacterium]|nr:amidohydrolase [Alphaproteobacteria bacterium]